MNSNFIQQWKFPSKSNPDKEHVVSLCDNGEYICGCWPFLKNKSCKHVDMVKSGSSGSGKLTAGRNMTVTEFIANAFGI